jgi:hypothetical protein
MRSGNLGKWLVQGTYPRLYVPVLLMILLASGVRYHFLIGSETAEITRLAEAEMRRVGDTMLPLLAAMPEGDVNAAYRLPCAQKVNGWQYRVLWPFCLPRPRWWCSKISIFSLWGGWAIPTPGSSRNSPSIFLLAP